MVLEYTAWIMPGKAGRGLSEVSDEHQPKEEISIQAPGIDRYLGHAEQLAASGDEGPDPGPTTSPRTCPAKS